MLPGQYSQNQIINVQINASGNAAVALTSIAQAAQNAAKAVGTAQNAANQAKGFGAKLGGFAHQAATKGIGSAASGAIGAGNPYLMAATAAMAMIARLGPALETLHNSFMTNAQKFNTLMDEAIPGWRESRRVGEALSGVNNALAQRSMATDIRKAVTATRFDYFGKELDARFAAANAQGRAAATRGAGYQSFVGYDRSTVSGQYGSEEQGLRLPAADAQTRARRGAMAAQAEVAAAMESNRRAAGEALNQSKKLADAKKAEVAALKSEDSVLARTFGSTKVERDDAHRRVLEANLGLTRAQAQQEAEVVRLREAQVKLAEAQSAARRADIDAQKAELEVLKQRESRMSGMQQRAGGMHYGLQLNALTALKAVHQYGIENVAPELADAASGVAPDFIARQREKFGGQFYERAKGYLGDDAFKTIFGGDFTPGRTLADTRQELNKVQAEIRVNINLDEQALADGIVKAITPTLQSVFKAVEVKLERVVQDIRSGRQISANQQN